MPTSQVVTANAPQPIPPGNEPALPHVGGSPAGAPAPRDDTRLGTAPSAPRPGARESNAARVLYAWLVFVIAAQVAFLAPGDTNLWRRFAASVISGAVFLFAYRYERRTASFARLSYLARLIYRLRAMAIGAMLLGSVGYFVPWLSLQPRAILLTAVIIALVGSAWGFVTKRVLGARTVKSVLFVGDDQRIVQFVADFARDPHPDFDLAGVLSTAPGTPQDIGYGIDVLGGMCDLESVLIQYGIDTVVLAVDRERLELFARLSDFQDHDITVQELSVFSENVFGRVPVDIINAAWFMHMIHPFYQQYSLVMKRIGDLAAALFIALLASPLVPLVWLAVRLTSRGPALYSQVRVGAHGQEFRIYKFRTMSVDAEKDGAQWAQKKDSRLTPIGGFMRSTRLDEIPQLWNIIRGQMSFVGPRPERPEFVTDLEAAIPYYHRRHLVKPGLTGWAQVRMGYSDSVEGAANKLGYELYYLKHRSLLLDFVIFVETIRVVALRFGAR